MFEEMEIVTDCIECIPMLLEQHQCLVSPNSQLLHDCRSSHFSLDSMKIQAS